MCYNNYGDKVEKFDVYNRLFYDGYDLDNKLLGDSNYIRNLLELINTNVFNSKGLIKVIPYFDGKVLTDGGVSGIILGNNFHFTCHTFSFKNIVFVDYYGNNSNKKLVEDILFSKFNTSNYDMGSKDVHGNFGKQIIFKTEVLSLNDAIDKVKRILIDINMTPIYDILVNKNSDDSFDIVQLIAESHISFHRNGDEMIVDVFSCKYFDVDKLLRLFDNIDDFIEVNRGINYY